MKGYKYEVEYLDGRREEAIGMVYLLRVDGVRRFFFDKFPEGLLPNWLGRFNEFMGENAESRWAALNIVDQKGGDWREFKAYWALLNLPEITKNYHFVRGPNDPPTKRGKKMFLK